MKYVIHYKVPDGLYGMIKLNIPDPDLPDFIYSDKMRNFARTLNAYNENLRKNNVEVVSREIEDDIE